MLPRVRERLDSTRAGPKSVFRLTPRDARAAGSAEVAQNAIQEAQV